MKYGFLSSVAFAVVFIYACAGRTNPTTEELMKRVDSLDSITAVENHLSYAADSEHNADSTRAATEYQRYHDSMEGENR